MSQKALAQPARGALPQRETRVRAMSRSDLLLLGLTGLSALMLFVSMWMVFLNTPMERTMGQVQRIFYWHVPSAWAGFLAFFVTFAASVAYLWKRDERADRIAVSSAEVGLVFLTMAMISGSLWAKPVWNTWWTWDARLTSVTITWLAYIAYFMLRGALDDPERARRLAAVYSLVAIVTVPITFLSIFLLRTIHPNLFGEQSGSEITMNMTSGMTRTFMFGLATFTVLYGALLWHRVRLEGLHRRVEELRARLSTKS